jgi:hypothetical protein
LKFQNDNDDDGKQKKTKPNDAKLPIERRRKRGRRAGKKVNHEKVQRTDFWNNDDDASNTVYIYRICLILSNLITLCKSFRNLQPLILRQNANCRIRGAEN